MPKSHPPDPSEFRQQMVELVRAGADPREELSTGVRALCVPGDSQLGCARRITTRGEERTRRGVLAIRRSSSDGSPHTVAEGQ